MKFRRTGSLIALAIALVSLLASGSQAAVLDSVRVVTPAASGGIRGIDSLITVEAYYRTTSVDSTVAVAFWLAKATSKTTVVGDTTKNNVALLDSVASAVHVNAVADTIKSESFVAASRRLYSTDPVLGDAEVLTITTGPSVKSGFSWKATWTYKLHASVGQEDGITPWVSVWDKWGTPNLWTVPLKAKRDWVVALDGDRPVPDKGVLLLPLVTSGGQLVRGFTGTYAVLRVLGLGDSVRVKYDLGNRADSVILANNLGVSCRFTYGDSTGPISLGVIKSRVDSIWFAINTTNAKGLGVIQASADTGFVEMFLSEIASGNLSSATKDDVAPTGVTQSAAFLIDAIAPVLDGGTIAGDTLLPVSNDTISMGAWQTGFTRDPGQTEGPDFRPILVKPGENLGSFHVRLTPAGGDPTDLHYFSVGADAKSDTFDIGGLSPFNSGNPLSTMGDQRLYIGDAVVPTGFIAQYQTYNGARLGNWPNMQDTSGTYKNTTTLKEGRYDLAFQGFDLAGNPSPIVTRTNVFVDLSPITLSHRFPAKEAFGPLTEARIDTIEEVTSAVQFALSEAADTVAIRYHGLSGKDADSTRTYVLTPAQCAVTTGATYPVAGLKDSTTYALSIFTRDMAGNVNIIGPDTLRYDTAYVVPLIKRFRLSANANRIGLEPISDHLEAGDTLLVNISADATTNGNRAAVTYKHSAVITVIGAHGVTLDGAGVEPLGPGRALLTADGWIAGKREIVLRDTVGYDSLRVTVADTTLTDNGPHSGQMDSLVIYQPNHWDRLLVTAPDTVVAGEHFTVNVAMADKYNNVRIFDQQWLTASTNKLGIALPNGPIWADKGRASFPTMSDQPLTGLIYRIASFSALNDYYKSTVALADNINSDHQIQGVSNAVTVVAAHAPASLAGEDYKGADGQGDQGGFVLLTWPASEDHATLTGYRIYRQLSVKYGVVEGVLAGLGQPSKVMVPWGRVDAVPGEAVGRAIVATLDTVSSVWAVAAERGMSGSATTGAAKEAFAASASVTTPYELMASTMVASRQAAVSTGAPVFATLSPEALAYLDKGVAPSMNTVASDLSTSALVRTATAVRAVDNIAPLAVSVMRAMDTPADAGSSVTITWTKSASDQLVARFNGNAVSPGAMGDQVAGVAGYNVYRKVGSGEYTLVGRAVSGQTSSADLTAANGVRYTYKVQPYDLDNETAGLVERTAMAIRNSAVDAQGQPVYGLFGADNRVGFDDFFVLADNFGMSAGDESFEPAFDLSANGRVDFEDFFVFADNFGRGIDAAGKTVPVVSGLNGDARLVLDAGTQLPAVGEEVSVSVSLSNYVELKGYGVSISYDANKLEFVKVGVVSNVLGEGDLAQPRVISQQPGQVSLAAYGDAATSGSQVVNLVFRTKSEIESTLIDVTDNAVRDASYGVNTLSTPSPVEIQTRPEVYALGNNYPNPFNPNTAIKYALPAAGFVKLEVYNVVGQVVRTLVSQQQSAGRYAVQWNATDNGGQSLSSGIYFYRLQAGDSFLEVKKMLLLK